MKLRSTRLRSARRCFRSSSLLSMPARLVLLGSGHGLCGADRTAAPLHGSLRSRLRPVRDSFNTILQQSPGDILLDFSFFSL